MKTKGNAQILMSLPKDGPSAIPPDYSLIIIDKLKSDVQNSFQFFDNDQAKDWWVKFLDGDSEGNFRISQSFILGCIIK